MQPHGNLKRSDPWLCTVRGSYYACLDFLVAKEPYLPLRHGGEQVFLITDVRNYHKALAAGRLGGVSATVMVMVVMVMATAAVGRR